MPRACPACGSWTTCSRSATTGRPRTRCSRRTRRSRSRPARPRRITLGSMVTAAIYRYPGVLIKTVTTLDVLSGGRAWLGIGAAWNEDESKALGIPFPPLGERFERLEETLRIAHAMWSGDEIAHQWHPLPAGAAARLAAQHPAAAPAHPHRWRRRAAHVPAHREVRRRLQPVRAERGVPDGTSWPCFASAVTRSAVPGRRSRRRRSSG